MTASAVVVAAAAVPLGWLGCLLASRGAGREPWFGRPLPRFPIPEEGSRAEWLMVHAVTSAALAVGVWRIDTWERLVPYLLLVPVLVALSVIDIQTLRLPDRIVLPATAASVVSFAFAAVIGGEPHRLLACLVGGSTNLTFLLVAHLIHPRGMGFGDVKLSALLGVHVGWAAADVVSALVGVFYSMLVGFLVGSVGGVVVMVARRRNAEYPFGPFLALGCLVVLLIGVDSLRA
ncbi:MAG: hypothetical protein KatS3mg008_0394 [Acidimicrobiales bacterium]|nr:MAG: hypothetical protein KatS3mg008_0394 [Acidimicrobiales bacterium]